VVTHQRSLFGTGDPGLAPDPVFEHVDLGSQSWVDVARSWFAGGDVLLDELMETVAWRQGRRRMYDRTLDDPRLSHWFADGEALPHPVMSDVRAALEARYLVDLGAMGLNYYRDGRDSVAFHRDRELRELDDTIVAIVTLGARRPFLVRPVGGGRSRDFAPASGDLLVMGGACQQHFEHGIPKVARAGPRVSMTWRWTSAPTRGRRR
jgi:alkylated DNA repair dioxygenase AlkB